MKYILSLLTLVPFLALSQCDLEIYDFHPETLETTIPDGFYKTTS
jgi:hypothetical protein